MNRRIGGSPACLRRDSSTPLEWNSDQFEYRREGKTCQGNPLPRMTLQGARLLAAIAAVSPAEEMESGNLFQENIKAKVMSDCLPTPIV